MAAADAPVRAATRGSTLARKQASTVASLLEGAGARRRVETVVVETTGDRRRDAEIWELGGRGVFVKEVQSAVLEGRADFAVHSAKDLPSATPPGLVIAAVPRRADARDALVGATLAGLPVGGLVATGSVRRRAQLAWLRPDLTFTGLRGNIETRLAKAGDYDAIVTAAAALERMGSPLGTFEVLEPWAMVPQVGQGALAVECREDDEATRELLGLIDHPPSHAAVDAERAFLVEMGGGCDRPVGAYATLDGGRVTVTGVVATGDGRVVLRHSAEGAGDPGAVGREVARHLLDKGGAAAVLDEAPASSP